MKSYRESYTDSYTCGRPLNHKYILLLTHLQVPNDHRWLGAGLDQLLVVDPGKARREAGDEDVDEAECLE
jgi:hypothetical protein